MEPVLVEEVREVKSSPVPETIKIQSVQAGSARVTSVVDEGTCILCHHCHGKEGGVKDLHCRRFPPAVYYNRDLKVAETKYPGVSTDFSCGEFKEE